MARLKGVSKIRNDDQSPSFGLPPCLRVPIAATGIEALETFVGPAVQTILGRNGKLQAILIAPWEFGVPELTRAPIWQQLPMAFIARQLFPERQVWVHVDYARYRWAYLKLGMPAMPRTHVLDHVQNRAAIRARFYSHPFLRLCPISRKTNSSGGHRAGTEGMERENLRATLASPKKIARLREYAASFKVAYADPIDLTKMLDIPPETKELQGVARIIKAFYEHWP